MSRVNSCACSMTWKDLVMAWRFGKRLKTAGMDCPCFKHRNARGSHALVHLRAVFMCGLVQSFADVCIIMSVATDIQIQHALQALLQASIPMRT